MTGAADAAGSVAAAAIEPACDPLRGEAGALAPASHGASAAAEAAPSATTETSATRVARGGFTSSTIALRSVPPDEGTVRIG